MLLRIGVLFLLKLVLCPSPFIREEIKTNKQTTKTQQQPCLLDAHFNLTGVCDC